MPKTLQLKLSTVVVAAALVLGAGGLAGYGVALRLMRVDGVNFNQLSQVYSILQQKFDGSIDPVKELDGAKAGLAAATGDPYTVYLDAKAAKALEDDLTGTLSGIGAEVGIKAQKLVVISPLDGSPAAKAGLRAGDQIIKIDGADPSGLSLDEAVSKIRGPKGTNVKLSIVRGSGAPFDVTITRDEITVASVKWSITKPGIGLIKISRFGPDTADKIDQAAGELKSQGATKIILDLRDDPGGYLDAAVKVGSEFLDQGQLIVEERHSGKSIDKLNSLGGGQLVGLPTVVLINGGSASASEIVAGALQDHKAATLVGETSFGKGSVQEVERLGGGAELKVTIAHWYTPGGKNINKEGIKPDVEIKMTPEDYDASRDPQLDKAIEVINSKS